MRLITGQKCCKGNKNSLRSSIYSKLFSENLVVKMLRNLLLSNVETSVLILHQGQGAAKTGIVSILFLSLLSFIIFNNKDNP